MSEVRSVTSGSVFDRTTDERRAQNAPARRTEDEGGLPTSWLVAGVAIALGAWAIYHFGSDFRRYIKMETM